MTKVDSRKNHVYLERARDCYNALLFLQSAYYEKNIIPEYLNSLKIKESDVLSPDLGQFLTSVLKLGLTYLIPYIVFNYCYPG